MKIDTPQSVYSKFLHSWLIKMTEGQTFALTSLKGIHIFKKIKFQDYQEKNNITLTQEGETDG